MLEWTWPLVPKPGHRAAHPAVKETPLFGQRHYLTDRNLALSPPFQSVHFYLQSDEKPPKSEHI